MFYNNTIVLGSGRQLKRSSVFKTGMVNNLVCITNKKLRVTTIPINNIIVFYIGKECNEMRVLLKEA